jgi:hypothetical protein
LSSIAIDRASDWNSSKYKLRKRPVSSGFPRIRSVLNRCKERLLWRAVTIALMALTDQAFCAANVARRSLIRVMDVRFSAVSDARRETY